MRWAGTREPPKTSATRTSAEAVGAVSSQARASAACRVIPVPAGTGRCRATRSRRPRSASTTSCREPGRVAARYRGRVNAPPPRCSTSSGRPSSATVSRTCPSRRAYSNSRCVGSSRSTYDCGAPSTVSSQARSRSTSGISLAVPWSTARVTGMESFTPTLCLGARRVPGPRGGAPVGPRGSGTARARGTARPAPHRSRGHPRRLSATVTARPSPFPPPRSGRPRGRRSRGRAPVASRVPARRSW